jgi:predicted Rdx family selenoprotein
MGLPKKCLRCKWLLRCDLFSDEAYPNLCDNFLAAEAMREAGRR